MIRRVLDKLRGIPSREDQLRIDPGDYMHEVSHAEILAILHTPIQFRLRGHQNDLVEARIHFPAHSVLSLDGYSAVYKDPNEEAFITLFPGIFPPELEDERHTHTISEYERRILGGQQADRMEDLTNDRLRLFATSQPGVYTLYKKHGYGVGYVSPRSCDYEHLQQLFLQDTFDFA